MPNLRSPSSASPESLSTTRPYLAFVWTAIGGSLGRLAVRLAQLEPLEPPNADVLSRCGSDPGNELADGLRRVTDVGLLEEVLQVLRIHRRDLHRDLLRELAEVRVARDEVGLARELDHRADPAARVQSITPAPVSSRRRLTSSFVFAITRPLSCPRRPRPLPPAPRSAVRRWDTPRPPPARTREACASRAAHRGHPRTGRPSSSARNPCPRASLLCAPRRTAGGLR